MVIDTSEVLDFKQARIRTGFAYSKFTEPEIQEALIAAGANYDVPAPRHRTFPVSALIAAGLLDENGRTTKRVYAERGSAPEGRSVSVSKLGLLAAEELLKKDQEELAHVNAEIEKYTEQEENLRSEYNKKLGAIGMKKVEQSRRQRALHGELHRLEVHIEAIRPTALAEAAERAASLDAKAKEAKAELAALKALEKQPRN